ALCISAALICASLRAEHPQMASAVAMAAGIAALLLSRSDIAVFSGIVKQLDGLSAGGGMKLLKICGIAMVAEFASDICRDAGETSLAKRIDTGVRLAIVVSVVPSAGSIMSQIAGLIR
ncbi:MAG: hypothetical protein IJA26_08685, partial [Clostridia bacterium]|nr:hypothetical protein [Clostridia bacterium]